ncbi:MAG: spore maturation protein [Lachnospirales bacterium]
MNYFNYLITYFSNGIIPLFIFVVILHSLYKKVDIFEVFKEGVFEGVKTVYLIFPTILGLMMAVSLLRSSGFLELLSYLFSYIVPQSFPAHTIPLCLMRLVSSSAATGILLDLFDTYGADSFTGRFISVMMSSTETVFYTMSVYFLSIKITKTRYTLLGALLSNLIGIVVAYFTTISIFGF